MSDRSGSASGSTVCQLRDYVYLFNDPVNIFDSSVYKLVGKYRVVINYERPIAMTEEMWPI